MDPTGLSYLSTKQLGKLVDSYNDVDFIDPGYPWKHTNKAPLPRISALTQSLLRKNKQTKSLCLRCRIIDFARLFDNSTHVFARSLRSIQRRGPGCQFCRLLLDALANLYPGIVKFSEGYCVVIAAPSVSVEEQTTNWLWLRWQSDKLDKREPVIRYAPWRVAGKSQGHIYPVSSGIAIQVISPPQSTPRKDTSLLLGRLVDQCVDMEVLRLWLDVCQSCHSEKCHIPSFNGSEFGMRVIDVHRRCVVPAPAGCRYVALSYVWGTAKQLLLTKDTAPRLLNSKHSLRDDDDSVPKTIRDAMIVCQRMGENFLWVDALCIQQDSVGDKRHQLNMMGRIYQCATFTIVAASGDSADSGLNGLRPKSRVVKQTIARVGDLTLGNTLPLFMDVVSDSVWNGRGWTCQEKHLSNRLLIFTRSQVFYQCRTSTFSEDVALEIKTPGTTASRLEASSVGNFRLAKQTRPNLLFATLLADYTSRKLTYASDALNAFSGILGTLSHVYTFFWGHPIENLLETLYWHSPQMSMERRRSDFPSWSWAGWDVPVEPAFLPSGFEPCEDRYPPIYPITKLYRAGSRGQCLPIDTDDSLESIRKCHLLDGEHIVWEPLRSSTWENEEFLEPRDQPYAWIVSFGKPLEPPPLTEEELVSLRSVRTRLLRFYTWTFKIPVGTDSNEARNQANERAHGLWIGGLGARVWVDPEWRRGQPEKLTFIALAQRRLPQWGATTIDFFLILIEEKGGVAYRIQRVDQQIDSDMLFSVDFCPAWRMVNLV